jgi:DNA-binding CsgD family transcriptional regulator
MTSEERLPESCAELRAELRRSAAPRGSSRRVFSAVKIGLAATALVLWIAREGLALVIFQEEARRGDFPSKPRLTRRELEILAWLGEGKSNTEIGVLLAISPRTVEQHCTNLFAKLGVESRLAAALFAHSMRA